jgi:hypothetical protein
MLEPTLLGGGKTIFPEDGQARPLEPVEIADELFISLSTTKTHLASVMTKLGARNRVELAMWA